MGSSWWLVEGVDESLVGTPFLWKELLGDDYPVGCGASRIDVGKSKLVIGINFE